jgi:thioester reductase-like protein
MNGRVRILRIGQLCGDTVTGYWNEKEGWPLLIRTAQTTGSLPDLSEVRLLKAHAFEADLEETILAAGGSCGADHVSDVHPSLCW